MSGKKTVAILFGGRSGEHEVSLMSARSVLGALDRQKYDVVAVGISHEGRWFAGDDVLEAFESGDLSRLHPVVLLPEPGHDCLYRLGEASSLQKYASLDVVFPVLHGTFGEDGTVQGLLELAEIPYVGAGVLASSVAMDKALFKTLMQSYDLPVLEAMVLIAADFSQADESVFERAEEVGDYPLFTKPANLGSSVGVTRCLNRSDLVEGLMEAAQYDRRVVIERGIDGREIEVSVLGNDDPQASIPGEIIPSDIFYTYRAKYLDDASELHIPAPISDDLSAEAQRLAIESFKGIDGAGMARVDFLLDKQTGELFLNEINTIPGFTQISMYPKLWEASGIPYPELMDRLIELAFDRHSQKSELIREYGNAA